MMPSGRRYSKTEFEVRGDKLYDELIATKLSIEDKGKFAAIDIETGDYEVAEDDLDASQRLKQRRPDSQIWMVRIGSRYVHRFGGAAKRRVP
ncbi:MAG: hypothetical protein QM703_00305 [Gemmatales bacterium]